MKGWWDRHFLRLEGYAAAFVAVAFGLWQLYSEKRIVVERSGDNIAILSAIAQAFASLLGFIIAAITFLFGLADRPELQRLRISHSYMAHWGIFKGALCASAFATLSGVVSLIAIAWGPLPSLIVILLAGSGTWLTLRMARVVWALMQMINGEIAIGRHKRAQSNGQ